MRRKKFVFWCILVYNKNFKKAKKNLFQFKRASPLGYMGYIESVPREKVITYIAAVNLRSFHKEVY